MLDPIPPPPARLASIVEPFADYFNLKTLPRHIHEVVFAALFYQFVGKVVSPKLSTYFFPKHYPHLGRRTQISWDVHLVSFVQASIINVLALWVMLFDKERKSMNITERVYAYTGACGLTQAFGAGYFLWDLIISTIYFPIFGIGSWAHAVAALWVYILGFRPFINYYAPTFLLYELSSPFLNIHWFCDKINKTGSPLQWYNGMALILSFFFARLIFGNYQSFRCFRDIFAAVNLPVGPTSSLTNATVAAAADIFVPRNGELCLGTEGAACLEAQSQVMQYTGANSGPVPLWMAVTYLGSNVMLNLLNVVWFGRMIATVKKRFDEPEPKPSDETKAEENTDGEGVRRKREDSVVLEVANGLEEDDFIGHPTSGVELEEKGTTGEVRKRTGA